MIDESFDSELCLKCREKCATLETVTQEQIVIYIF